MSRYKPYPEYKDSGVEWLGHAPAPWQTMRFKRVLSEKKKTANPSLRAGSISFGRVVFKETDNLSQETKDSYQEVLSGEFLVNPLNLNYDLLSLRTALSEIDVVVSTGYIVLKAGDEIRPRYLRWLLHEFDVSHMKTLGAGVRQTINFSDIGNSFFSAPSGMEQEAIAAFLDHETAKIDALIEKQRRLIELLKEKRQAVISHAVTKGLDPDAPMKDSGVEWLGAVPAHWGLAKIKHLTLTFDQGWSPQCDARPAEGNEFGVLKVGCVNGGVFNPEENKALPPELEPQTQYKLKKWDLLISRANTRDLVGSAAVVRSDFDKLILCDKLYRLRFPCGINPELIAFYLSLPFVRQQIELGASGASDSMQNISQSVIKDLVVLVPPEPEAIRLVQEIEDRTKNFDTTLEKVGLQIGLLQERRTALISAAVTGKIDVRDWQAAA